MNVKKIYNTHRNLILWLLFVCCLAPIAAGNDVRIIASFEEPASTRNWISVNDGVMGGVSTGGFERTVRNTLLFKGFLSLENNGGFASIRTRPGTIRIAAASGIIVKARGDGRTYWVGLRTDGQSGVSSYRALLPSSSDRFTEVFIPISDFKLQRFGREIPGRPIDSADITSIGFTIADNKAGAFQLEIETIAAVFDTPDTLSADPDTDPDEAFSQILTYRELIRLAIDRGVPLFNRGETEACAAIYEVTCEALRSMPGVSEESRTDITGALIRMRTAETDQDKAWILRYAMDRVLSRGSE